jgi:hypothetical protein
MGGTETLLTIAELAIGLAGFSAVVAAFTIRGELSPTDRSRFIWLFTTAFVAALLAFVPSMLSEAGLADATLWRASSGIWIVAWLISTGIFAIGLLRRDPSKWRPRWSALTLVPSVLNLALVVMNVWGVAWEPSGAVYIFSTLLWLCAAALVFMSIVLERPAA